MSERNRRQPQPMNTVAGSVGVTVVLLAIVGLASGARAPTATAFGAPGLGVLLLHLLESLAILVALAGVVLIATAWARFRRRKKPEVEYEHYVEAIRVHWAVKLLLMLVPLAMIAGIVAGLVFNRNAGTQPTELPVPGHAAGPVLSPSSATSRTSPEYWSSFDVVFAVVLLVVVGLSLVWWWRHRTMATQPETAADPFAAVIDDGLAALERESDPRRAVILAYHAMERALARRGFGRNRAEAPLEYMFRVLAHVPDCRAPVQRLTDLFEEAKYSHHPIDVDYRVSAVEALHAVRNAFQARA